MGSITVTIRPGEEPTEHQRQRDLRRRTPTLRTLAITQNITVDGSIEMLGTGSTPRARPV
jgi:hypothetical protein